LKRATVFFSIFWILIRPGFNWVRGRIQIRSQESKTKKKLMFSISECSLRRAGGFFKSLEVLRGGPTRNIPIFFFFNNNIILNFLLPKPQIRIQKRPGSAGYGVTELLNQDPQHYPVTCCGYGFALVLVDWIRGSGSRRAKVTPKK
jgi:hypothetical protein